MTAVRKILLTVGALFAGPIFIMITNPFLSWSVTGGLMMMALTSGAVVYGVWRKPKKEDTPDRLWGFVRQCWVGDQQLWKIFWIVGVGVTAVIQGISYAGTEYNAPMIWWIVVLILVVPIEVWWLVSVWRCAKNTNKKIWEVLSKIIVVITGANSVYRIFLVVAYPFGI